MMGKPHDLSDEGLDEGLLTPSENIGKLFYSSYPGLMSHCLISSVMCLPAVNLETLPVQTNINDIYKLFPIWKPVKIL